MVCSCKAMAKWRVFWSKLFLESYNRQQKWKRLQNRHWLACLQEMQPCTLQWQQDLQNTYISTTKMSIIRIIIIVLNYSSSMRKIQTSDKKKSNCPFSMLNRYQKWECLVRKYKKSAKYIKGIQRWMLEVCERHLVCTQVPGSKYSP